MTYLISDFRRDLDSPYAWPGGYPKYFITRDGAALSVESAKANADLITESMRDRSNDGWQVTACAINWEDAELYCDHSSERIESAYAEED